MAVGLLIGVGFDPTPADFEELLTKGALKQRDFQYVTAELSMDEARDREQIKEYYKAACVNQNWPEGIKYSEALKFSDVVVFGKPALIVEPKGFDQPAPKIGAIIAGIGFSPSQADLDQFLKQIKFHQDWEYILKNYSMGEASSEVFLTSNYIATLQKRGWADSKSPLSIHKFEIGGKKFLLLQPSLPGEAKDEGKKEAKPAAGSPSEKIVELFNREKIDPAGKKILAFAILFEREIAPAAWVGPGDDPYGVEGESTEARQARFYASKIIPGYQPHFIPAHLSIDQDTRTTGRRLQKGESLDASHINPELAGMLADLLPDQDLSRCSALSLSGESTALGNTRFAVVVGEPSVTKGETKQQDDPFADIFQQPIIELPKTKTPRQESAPPARLINNWADEIKKTEDRETNKWISGCVLILIGIVAAGLIIWLLRDYLWLGIVLGVIGIAAGLLLFYVAERRDKAASERLANKIIDTCESKSFSKTLVVEELSKKKISGDVNKTVLSLVEPETAAAFLADEQENEKTASDKQDTST
ncbi:MAG: DUF308 domain-containing protein [Anaerolineales bacterium]